MNVISTSGITKKFGSTVAVNGLSIQVNQGEIYGFLGLNGAGKTTLIRMLLGMIRPDTGNIQLFQRELGRNFHDWNNIGYLVETPHAYPNLSVKENLFVYYHLRQMDRRDAVSSIIKKLKLDRYTDIKAGQLSLGNKQRLGLAKALLHEPKLLILDEPTNGLDPQGILEVRQLIKQLSRQGITVFVSSHILDEISKLATRIAIIHEGELKKELSIEELNKQLNSRVIVETLNNQWALTFLTEAGYTAELNYTNAIEITDSRALTHSEEISGLLAAKGLPVREIYIENENLETYFLKTISS